MGKCYYCVGSDYIGDHGVFILVRQFQKCRCTYPEEYKNSDNKHGWGNEFTNIYQAMVCNFDDDSSTFSSSNTYLYLPSSSRKFGHSQHVSHRAASVDNNQQHLCNFHSAIPY